jgi:hypothetical protein
MGAAQGDCGAVVVPGVAGCDVWMVSERTLNEL